MNETSLTEQRMNYLRKYKKPNEDYRRISNLFKQRQPIQKAKVDNKIDNVMLSSDTSLKPIDRSKKLQMNNLVNRETNVDNGYYKVSDLSSKWQHNVNEIKETTKIEETASEPVTTYYPKFKTTSTLKNGSKGSNARNLQNYLKTMGYNPGPIDGIFGPKTKAAVKRLQKAMGLSTDGIVGKNTWAAINSHREMQGSTSSAVSSSPAPVKSQYDLLLEGPVPYTPMSEDELRDMAVNEKLSEFNNAWKTYSSQYDIGKSNLHKSADKISSSYQDSMDKLNSLYEGRRIEAESQALKRGIGRSTMAVNMIDAVESDKASEGINLLRDYNSSMVDITNKLYDLNTQLYSEKATMDANLEYELNNRYNQLLTEQNEKILDMQMYNVKLLNEQKEFDEKMRLDWKKYYKK